MGSADAADGKDDASGPAGAPPPLGAAPSEPAQGPTGTSSEARDETAALAAPGAGDAGPVGSARASAPGVTAEVDGQATGTARRGRRPRPHPYADEVSTPAELAHDPRRVALFWVGLATAIAAAGLILALQFSNAQDVPSRAPSPHWGSWIQVPLFSGLGLLGFGFVDRPWAKRLTLAGWLLFGFYWSLVALDLFHAEVADYVNFGFALLGTYFFTYLAYHQWLSQVRGIDSHTVHFLNVATFVAAGAYFLIDQVPAVRAWLILTVSDHTFWMLDLFGQGNTSGAIVSTAPDCPYSTEPQGGAGLVYCVNPEGSTDDNGATLTRFSYQGDVGRTPEPDSGFWSQVMHFDPTEGSRRILPVSIILACTALQSIMLFVGLFMATPATWKKRLWASAIVAVVVYVLNLVRNTGIIWFYGQGEASFWVMHDAIGKGGSLVAMIAIAFASFAWFPEFLKSLIGVLDLPYRDGPLERALRLGKRRPVPGPTPEAIPGPANPPG